MSDTNSRKSFWWYFIRVTILTIVFFVAVLLLSDFNYGLNKTVGWAWDLSNIRFWLGVLLYFSIAFGFLSLITVLVMKISKLTQ
ncbi:hypothetical protein [uncultured Psychroserpens sp.]|uniref:hypothetical protein n=1 Tax=uncultured Psychroserpens sp. TaxID=255436 RepID=UPI0026166AB5|nr:hypothetical protein [uncultured Psychroserpens sp.]